MTSCGRLHCWFAVSARWKRRKLPFRNIHHCSLRWLGWWARCWMLQDMDNMEAGCVFYIKVSTFTHLEQCKTSLVTVNKSGIVRLTVQHDLIPSISWCIIPGIRWDKHQQTSFPSNIVLFIADNHLNFGCGTPQFIPVNTKTTTDRHITHRGAGGNPCHLQLSTAEFILSITNTLAADYSIPTWT